MIFVSKFVRLNLVMKPGSKSYVDGRVIVKAGRSIQFENGKYKTEDKKEIDFIRKHRLFSTAIFEHEPENLKVVVEKAMPKKKK